MSLVRFNITHRYNSYEHGELTKRKARCSLCGNNGSEKLIYYPESTEVNDSDKITFRAGHFAAGKKNSHGRFSFMPMRLVPTRHIDFLTAFTAEIHNHDKPIPVKRLRRFDEYLTVTRDQSDDWISTCMDQVLHATHTTKD